VKVKLMNPSIGVGGRTLTFPAELESGSYLEWDGAGEFTVYGPDGTPVETATPEGSPLLLEQGDNVVRFACDRVSGPQPRAYVSLSMTGDALT
jgi:hypothetical protein